ncbi:MAG: hypothetical protein C5B52_16305 [Bacteroidetes bacterium]|nr:MAG: hypothetical protein C5B52_16305 [Bacteroidota bacterium]
MTKMDVNVQENVALHAGIGEHIGFELGARLIKNYHDLNGKTASHFVGKDILSKMLNQPDCIGINIYKAINEEGSQTYVLVGVDSTGKKILEYSQISAEGCLESQEGIVADRLRDDSWSLNWTLV